jgi:hypothetical protein
MRIGTSSRINRKRRVWWRTVLFSERYEYHPSIPHHSGLRQDPRARGLHPEKRMVHRAGTVFQQTYWVRGERGEPLEARRQKSSPASPSSTPPPSVSPPTAPAPSHGAGAPPSPAELDVEQLPAEVCEALSTD